MLKKYRRDIILIVVLLIIFILVGIFYFIFNDNNIATKAYVYHDEELILEIDLSKDNVYEVEGSVSVLHIEVKDGSIRVLDSLCYNQICVNEGFKNKNTDVIVCLPNLISITLE